MTAIADIFKIALIEFAADMVEENQDKNKSPLRLLSREKSANAISVKITDWSFLSPLSDWENGFAKPKKENAV